MSNRSELITHTKTGHYFPSNRGRLLFFGNLTEGHKITLFELTLKHCSEAVCTLLWRTASVATAIACSAASSGPADQLTPENTLMSRRLQARAVRD